MSTPSLLPSHQHQQYNYNNTESLSPESAVRPELKRAITGDSSEEVSPFSGLPVKKKRKQLVACDSCRLRRVRCNRAEVPTGADCSECEKKGIKCTDTYIANKPRVVRSGKLIQRAKELYGDHQGGDGVSGSSSLSDLDRAKSSTPAPLRRARSPIESQSVIRAAEARFVSSELGKAISAHLVQNYFEHVHNQCHLVDAPSFNAAWDAAGRDTDQLSPTYECLALVIQAWSARFSDHPTILGPNAPTIAELKKRPAQESLCGWGDKRQTFAKAMSDRALQAIDQHGILRRPTVASATACVLLEFLITWEDVKRTHSSAGRHLMSGAAELYRSLVDGVTDDPSENQPIPDRATGGTLFWVLMSRDAVSSALGARSPALSNEDLASLCEIVVNPISDEVLAYITSDDPKILAGLGVIGIFKHITMLFRACSARVSGPIARRQAIDGDAVRELWTEMDNSQRWAHIFRAKGNALVPPLANAQNWFRDSLNMRSQLTIAIHTNLEARIEAERIDPNPAFNTAPDGGYLSYLDGLLALKAQSDQRLLAVGREFVKFMYDWGHRLMFDLAFSCENLSYFLEHMLRTPVWGQGGPPDWTPAKQAEEIEWGISALQVAGWCWSGYRGHVENLRDGLGHLALQAQRRRAAEVRAQNEHQRRNGQDINGGLPYGAYSQGSYPPQNGWQAQAPSPYGAYAPPPVRPLSTEPPAGFGYANARAMQQQQPSGEYDDKRKLGHLLSADYTRQPANGQGGW